MSELMVLLAIAAAAVSGLPGLLAGRASSIGQRTTTLMMVLAAGLGLGGVASFWATGIGHPIVRPWRIPGGEFHVAMDGLSAIFLAPIFLTSMLGSIYGLGYWRSTEHPRDGRKLGLFYGMMTAGMALLVIARNSLLFLCGWEVMSLSAFFLVTTEDDQVDVRQAGWLYLVATHVATLCLFALFALLHAVSGSYTLDPLPAGAATGNVATAAFVLALVGFGFKAGIMPLHVWLPGAHAAAPSHVSAIMSGVLIKMGIYGLVRVTSILTVPRPDWGFILLALGVVSGILGVAFAVGQHDLKRLLAYHSIENIGIIVMGLGLALLGRSAGRVDWIALGLGGALLHVWNHGIFKALLFYSAGSVIHATGTRDIEALGGLARPMPWTSAGFLVGAVAICGLPPLNGFVSEFLIYLGLFGTLMGEGSGRYAIASLAAPALAMIGVLAVACFVKAYGMVFLGVPRTRRAGGVHESPPSLLGPMGVLAAACGLIGLAPRLAAPALQRAIDDWAPESSGAGIRLTDLAPLDRITVMGLMLAAALAALAVSLRLLARRNGVARAPTWGCGYLEPGPRMQYTASSLAEMLVGLFGWVLRPRVSRPSDLAVFPGAASFHSTVPDPVLEEAVLPAFRFGLRAFSWFRVLQGGSVQAYLVYVFVALMILLLWR